MSLNRSAREKLVRALAVSVIEHADELTSLDQAIGDGDHGLNMKRGFEAVLATLPALADKSMPEMLKAIGMTLVMKVGGASGPLVGTFFMELGKALPEEPSARRSRRGDGQGDRRGQGARTLGSRAEDPARCPRAGAGDTCGRRRRHGDRRGSDARPPSARRRCSRRAAGRPFSANVPSVIWIRVRARRPS